MTSLSQALDQYGTQAYLLTVAPEGPHTSHVDVALHGSEFRFALGGTGQTNARNNANVSLLWPALEKGGYSIVANGVLTLDGDSNERATVAISKSVLHRPGPARIPGGPCSSDCLQLSLA